MATADEEPHTDLMMQNFGFWQSFRIFISSAFHVLHISELCVALLSKIKAHF